jgi:hypothetical protein
MTLKVVVYIFSPLSLMENLDGKIYQLSVYNFMPFLLTHSMENIIKYLNHHIPLRGR